MCFFLLQGGSRLSENRKAMQAGIKVPWDQEEAGNAIARLSRRVYDYANSVLGLDIEEHGQEDLMSIQYKGRGFNDSEPDVSECRDIMSVSKSCESDCQRFMLTCTPFHSAAFTQRYTPHCDGDCTGLPHKSGSRMATVVMYCTVADRGGHTNFRNSGVHVKPKSGDAIFFSYIDPVTKMMDSGFTEHSGCPVYEGDKKIVTQWIRLGVDTENPWDSFNTLGIKLSEIQKLESDLGSEEDADEDGEIDDEDLEDLWGEDDDLADDDGEESAAGENVAFAE